MADGGQGAAAALPPASGQPGGSAPAAGLCQPPLVCLGLRTTAAHRLSASYMAAAEPSTLWSDVRPAAHAWSSCRAAPRCPQVLELAAFVRSHGRGSAATVLAGDLNAAPDTLELALLKVGTCCACCPSCSLRLIPFLRAAQLAVLLPQLLPTAAPSPTCATRGASAACRAAPIPPRCCPGRPLRCRHCCHTCGMRGRRRSRCGWGPLPTRWRTASRVGVGAGLGLDVWVW